MTNEMFTLPDSLEQLNQNVEQSKPILDVYINNYNNLKDVKLQFKYGTTALIGQSNAGKSSILKAIYSLFYNKFTKQDIRQSQKELTVCYHHIPTDTKIQYSLSNTQNKYTITTPQDTYQSEKNAKQVPPEINQVYPTDPDYNFWKQLTPPFLTSYSSQDLFKQLNQSSISQNLQTIQHKIKEDIKSLNSQTTTNEALLTQNQNTLQQTKSTLSLLSQIPIIDTTPYKQGLQILKSLQQDITSLNQLNSQISQLQSKSLPKLPFTHPTDIMLQIYDLLKLQQNINQLQIQVENITHEQELTQQALSHFTTCPLCHSVIKS